MRNRLRVLYDHQIFEMQKYGGISRYFAEIIKCYNTSERIETILPIKMSDNEYLNKIPPFSSMDLKPTLSLENFLLGLKFRGKSGLYSIYNKIIKRESNYKSTISALKNNNFDLFHPTYYDTYFLNYLNNKPFVLTIYDMIHEIYSQNFSIIDPISRRKRILAQKASKIIAISKNTKKDIMRIFKIPAEKIEVVYIGQSLKSKKNINKKLPSTLNDYILFVGTRISYKNFIFFIKAISQLLKVNNIKCVCCGGGSFTKKEIDMFKKLEIKNHLIQYSINDEELAYLYQNAICFVFPTLYEGFGIPILEAYKNSCPVAVSNTSSLPEVGGKAALYFDPEDEQSILKTVENIIRDKNLRQQMIQNGKKQVEKFSWEKCSKKTINVYEKII